LFSLVFPEACSRSSTLSGDRSGFLYGSKA
jgi:hypothetical protein